MTTFKPASAGWKRALSANQYLISGSHGHINMALNQGRIEHALRHASSMRETVEDITASIVEEARAQGLSWQKVGDALGITKQAAQQKYGSRAAAAPSTNPDDPGLF